MTACVVALAAVLCALVGGQVLRTTRFAMHPATAPFSTDSIVHIPR